MFVVVGVVAEWLKMPVRAFGLSIPSGITQRVQSALWCIFADRRSCLVASVFRFTGNVLSVFCHPKSGDCGSSCSPLVLWPALTPSGCFSVTLGNFLRCGYY